MSHDVVVVGAGPAGAMTALSALETDPTLQVMLVDRRKEIGVPVQCAGGIVKRFLDEAGLELPPEVIASELRGVVMHGPDRPGGAVEAVMDASAVTGGDPIGYVMHRDRFDQWLVAMACEAGADLRLGEDASMRRYDYDCKYLVGADGWRSQMGRHFKMCYDLKGDEKHIGIEYRVAPKEICDPGLIHIYFGNEIAPGGYIWVFPESEHIVKVGCGIPVTGFSSRSYLDRFLQNERHPWRGEVLGISAGGVIPSARPVDYYGVTFSDARIRDGGIEADVEQYRVLVGDAARMTDPLHGGGIGTALLAGRQLGRAIADDDIMQYERWCRTELSRELERRFLLSRAVQGWKDKHFEYMIEVMRDTELTDEHMYVQVRRFVWKLLLRHPRMFPINLFGMLKARFFD